MGEIIAAIIVAVLGFLITRSEEVEVEELDAPFDMPDYDPSSDPFAGMFEEDSPGPAVDDPSSGGSLGNVVRS